MYYHLAAVAGLGAGAGVGVARVLVVAAHVVRRVVLVRGDRALDTESVRMISHYSVYNVMSQYCPIMMSCHNIIYISLMPGSCAGSPSSRSWAGRGRSSGPGHLYRYFHEIYIWWWRGSPSMLR